MSNDLTIDSTALDKAMLTIRPKIVEGYVHMAQVGQIPCAQIEILTDMKMVDLRPYIETIVRTYLELRCEYSDDAK